jgi:hypothetical protein
MTTMTPENIAMPYLLYLWYCMADEPVEPSRTRDWNTRKTGHGSSPLVRLLYFLTFAGQLET